MRTKALPMLALLLLSLAAVAQESDFAVKQSFEIRVTEIRKAIDGAASVATLDSLKGEIATLERDFDGKREFLDRALYPHTYDQTLVELKDLHLITYDRVYLIQTQGIRLSDLEAQITAMSLQIDTLTNEKNSLFAELQKSKKNQTELREVVRRLSANLDAKDKLIFAMTDSIFLPYGKDLNQASEMQKEAVGKRLGQANVLTRVNEIATDNIRFLESTQLQPKDYANLIDQQEQFSTKWNGLREKMVAVALPAFHPACRDRQDQERRSGRHDCHAPAGRTGRFRRERVEPEASGKPDVFDREGVFGERDYAAAVQRCEDVLPERAGVHCNPEDVRPGSDRVRGQSLERAYRQGVARGAIEGVDARKGRVRGARSARQRAARRAGGRALLPVRCVDPRPDRGDLVVLLQEAQGQESRARIA